MYFGPESGRVVFHVSQQHYRIKVAHYGAHIIRGIKVNVGAMDTLDDEEADDDFSSFGQAAGAKTAAAVSLDDE